MAKVCYEEMLPHEVVEGRKKKPLVFCPLARWSGTGCKTPWGWIR